MKKQDITVILLSYNTKKITETCIIKLKKSKDFCEKKLGNKIKVIVVDQGSKDGSALVIKNKFNWVNVLSLSENLGFAKGNNLAMRQVRSPYILLINSDTFLNKDTLYKVLKNMDENPNIDMLQVGFRYANGGFEPCGGYLPNPLNTILRFFEVDILLYNIGLIKPIPVMGFSFYAKDREMEWISGAFMFLKSQVFEKTKGFDENIFFYGEDLEWCKRIKDAGFRIQYTSKIWVTHLSGASTHNECGSSYIKQLKGYLYYHEKYFPKYHGAVKSALILSLSLKTVLFAVLDNAKARVYKEILRESLKL